VHIRGISCYFHDAAAALLRDGQLVAAAEQERFSRKKHDAGFPADAIAFCLRAAGITAGDLDYVVFYEKPFRHFERLLVSTLGAYPRSRKLFRDAMVSWLGDKLWIKDLIRNRLASLPPRAVRRAICRTRPARSSARPLRKRPFDRGWRRRAGHYLLLPAPIFTR
jgi:predicted NodU family carbamoyl transferase